MEDPFPVTAAAVAAARTARACPVCDADCVPADVLDLNKSCEEARGTVLPAAGIPIAYVQCSRCRFCFAPEMHAWPRDDFAAKIYNADYTRVDPDHDHARPQANAAYLRGLLGAQAAAIRHLDYGGGNGLLSRLLVDAGWNSTSYDPYYDDAPDIAALPRFDLITAFEVFEHVPDVQALMTDLNALLEPDGVILFSTMVSDGHIPASGALTWWYAAPRNGHISLYSRDSLYFLAAAKGMHFGSYSPNLHVFWRTVPAWAARFLDGS